jgi:hypothetical protein
LLTVARQLRLSGTPSGDRVMSELHSFDINGDRLKAKLTGQAAADWMVIGRDGTMLLDVRLTLETHDGALIYMQANGRANAATMLKGGPIFMVARFETGDSRYGWLNGVVTIAKGKYEKDCIRYEVFEVR